jgi:hypothetical protein
VDGSQFDRLAKGLAAGRSRRGVLRGLGAAALGALGLAGRGGAGAADACKGTGKACSKNGQCCSGLCAPAPGKTSVAGGGAVCCAPGQVTNATTGACCTPKTCADFPGQCGTFSDNCGGTLPCQGATCQRGADVPAGTCNCNGTCCPVGCRCDFDETSEQVRCFDVRLIRGDGIPCGADSDCPVGAACNTFSGFCNPTVCVGDPSSCPTGSGCSGGLCLAYCSA